MERRETKKGRMLKNRQQYRKGTQTTEQKKKRKTINHKAKEVHSPNKALKQWH